MTFSRTPQFFSASIVIAALTSCEAAGPAAKTPVLSPADEKLLAGLLQQVLFDPKGAQFVRVKTPCRTTEGKEEEIIREGWLVTGKDGKPARVCFTDGESIAAPKKIENLNFPDQCRERFGMVEDLPNCTARVSAAVAHFEKRNQMGRTAVGWIEQLDLVLAAWLYRLGQRELAAEALARARENAAKHGLWGCEDGANRTLEDRMLRGLKKDLASTDFSFMLRAYMVRADDEALAHGERLLRLYPDIVKAEYAQADAVVGELKRRKAKGTFGKTPPEKRPDGFDSWEPKKKIAWLIDSLGEVDTGPWIVLDGSPSRPMLEGDRRVAALIEIGDRAVPALIDTIEKDTRLTRCVHFCREYGRTGTALSVREAALTAVMSILQVQVFESASDDNFTCRGAECIAATVKRLRQYWQTNGGLPFDERMMKMLTDRNASPAARLLAAQALANPEQKWPLSIERSNMKTINGWLQDPPAKPGKPAVAKFAKPTVAEAILVAMDVDRSCTDEYLQALLQLGDRRIAGELARRFKAETGNRIRGRYASACCSLGEMGPIKTLAAGIEKGSLKLPGSDDPESFESGHRQITELGDIVAALVHAGLPECDRALFAMVAPSHPYHAWAVAEVFRAAGPGSDYRSWLAHPFCLAVLRERLDDTSGTGGEWRFGGENLELQNEHSSCYQTLPECLRDPATRRKWAAERNYDAAALKLGDLVLGLPEYNPLLKDADARLAKMKRLLDRYRCHFRVLSGTEAEALGINIGYAMFVPDIRPLGRAATPVDVEQGRAVFHLNGKAKSASLPLPSVATLRQPAKGRQASRVLVVQAEIGPDGKTTYGIIGNGDVRAASEGELAGIKPIAKVEDKRGGSVAP